MKHVGLFIGLVLSLPSLAFAFSAEEYAKRKAAGTVVLSKVGTDPVVSIPRYDPDTGVKQDSSIARLNVSDLNAEKTRLQTRIAEIDQLLADIAALP